jgi:phospholipid-binding lipoprotein MlaA
MILGRPAIALLAVPLLLAGCASVPRDPATRAVFKANNDPLEPLNRRTFAFNLFLDRILIKPIAKGYRRALPGPGRDAIRHFLDNLDEPIVFANTALQGRFRDAGTTAARFLVNSIAGFAGLDDPASRGKLRKQVGDFGQTLWAWGIPEGPYLIVPVIGPSSPRDLVGSGVDVYGDPFRYIARQGHYPTALTAGRTVVDGIDKRSRNIESLEEMQREAVDYYASFRSLFRQNRAAELRNNASAPPLPPDFYEDPGSAR